MHPSEPPFLQVQFYLTASYPCSYIDGLVARSQVAAPAHLIGPAAYERLIQAGFRRSGDFTYRPHCQNCKRCVPVRVIVEDFKPNRTQKRCWQNNQDMVVDLKPLEFSQEHFELYCRYQAARHPGGGMDQDDSRQYSQFLLTSQVDTSLVEFREAGVLRMVCVVDRLQSGLSAVYSFFDPSCARRSLGTYAVLWQIQLARELGLSHVYLGYWIRESQKMAYKSNFRPLQAFVENRWVALGEEV